MNINQTKQKFEKAFIGSEVSFAFNLSSGRVLVSIEIFGRETSTLLPTFAFEAKNEWGYDFTISESYIDGLIERSMDNYLSLKEQQNAKQKA